MNATVDVLDVNAALDGILDRAMRSYPPVQHVVLTSEQGLVIAHRSRTKAQAARLAALPPVLADAGETMFNELGLMPLSEVILMGPEGVAYQVRMKSHPAFVLVAASGAANLGLLRMLAAEIEAGASEVLHRLLR